MSVSYTAQEVFEAAMNFLDNQDETGATDISDNAEYKYRTPYVLNQLIPQLYPYSDTYPTTTAGTRPIADPIVNMTSVIPLDDVLTLSVLPLGLAYMLVLSEDGALASNFKSLYDEALMTVRNRVPVESEAITDVYGFVYSNSDD